MDPKEAGGGEKDKERQIKRKNRPVFLRYLERRKTDTIVVDDMAKGDINLGTLVRRSQSDKTEYSAKLKGTAAKDVPKGGSSAWHRLGSEEASLFLKQASQPAAEQLQTVPSPVFHPVMTSKKLMPHDLSALPSPILDVEEIRSRKMSRRAKVIQELVQTEKDYLTDLELCIREVVQPLRVLQVVDVDRLFTNMETVCEVSAALLHRMHMAMSDPDPEAVVIGEVFIQAKAALEDVYKIYCYHHDDANMSLKAYEREEQIKQHFTTCILALKKIYDQEGKPNLLDMGSLLIKPVQRVMKYPLLLGELWQATPEDHIDYLPLQEALTAAKIINVNINEFRRRKDIVMKYKRLENDEGTLRGKLNKINIHSLRKKGDRFAGYLKILTGVEPQVRDEVFDKEEKLFRSLEKAVRQLAKNVNCYVQNTQEMVPVAVQNVKDMENMITDPSKADTNGSSHKNGKDPYKYFKERMEELVLVPLTSLQGMFTAPQKLIQKPVATAAANSSAITDVTCVSVQEVQHQTEEQRAWLLAEYPPNRLYQLKRKCNGCQEQDLSLLEGELVALLEDTDPLGSSSRWLVHNGGKSNSIACLPESAEIPATGDKGYVYSTFLKQYNPLRDSQRANQKAKEQQQPPVITYEDFDDLSLFVSPSSSSSMRSLSLNTTDSSSTLSGLQGEQENAEELEESVDGDTQQYYAVYAFQARCEQELSLQEYQHVRILQFCDLGGNKQWWLAEANGQKGYVPANYLGRISAGVSWHEAGTPEKSVCPLSRSHCFHYLHYSLRSPQPPPVSCLVNLLQRKKSLSLDSHR
ncbi:hypothetical protein CCH79_00014011 [Gambusia affinis]|uniref:Scaffold protein Tuba n=1 Tax=Gambusia affinis TaxID=33528 RepID=A0A315W275_GAMAF|nr:hypothetical protein CCH79_00014011 [Gambusia affinis]